MEAQDKSDLIEINTLIDLTDKPIGLTREEIGWSKVRSNASNCICCCCNNSITLVTTNDSYILDHVPLDNIQFAQTNASLQYLALSNHVKIAIIDLVDNDIRNQYRRKSSGSGSGSSNIYNGKNNSMNNNKLATETKIVNLSAHGLTMNDIIFWRWLNNNCLAILSYEALYTCSMSQQHINHPAYTAFSNRSRYLSMHKVLDAHEYLTALCQVTDIHQDVSGNLFAISSLYSTGSLLRINNSSNASSNTPQNSNGSISNNTNLMTNPINPGLTRRGALHMTPFFRNFNFAIS